MASHSSYPTQSACSCRHLSVQGSCARQSVGTHCKRSSVHFLSVWDYVSDPLKPLACSCKLLYVTPEQFVKGTTLQTALQRLHSRGLLARIVIDEVGLRRK